MIEQYIPKVGSSIDGIGFLFGAGASYEAGYPLISDLTKQVIGQLVSEHRVLLDDILGKSEQSYDDEKAVPNIESIADTVTSYAVQTDDDNAKALIDAIRSAITDCILSVETPDLTHHVAFFEALKKRAYSRAAKVFIFTTNYDLLFEEAAAETGLKLTNGFSGPIRRFWSEKEFSLEYGQTDNNRFRTDPSLNVILVKLHGSISWAFDDGRLFEMDPLRLANAPERCMVLPRRTKVMETLGNPYDRLFSVAARILGRQCKYLIAGGFSFGDDHINDALLLPSIEDGRISLTNFCLSEPNTLKVVRGRQNVTHVCSDKLIKGGVETDATSDLWQFSAFAKAF